MTAPIKARGTSCAITLTTQEVVLIRYVCRHRARAYRCRHERQPYVAPDRMDDNLVRAVILEGVVDKLTAALPQNNGDRK